MNHLFNRLCPAEATEQGAYMEQTYPQSFPVLRLISLMMALCTINHMELDPIPQQHHPDHLSNNHSHHFQMG